MTKHVHHTTNAARPDIALHEVKSSQVKSVGHDPKTNTLAVQFTRGTGAIYHYPNVSSEAHQAFVKADSIGVHFGKHIKSLPFDKYVPHKA
jgi:hypothetical protein